MIPLGKTIIVLGIVSSLTILHVRCVTTPLCISPSTIPIHGKMNLEKLGKTSGSSHAWSIFGLWMIGRPDMKIAIDEALRTKNAMALIDITCYETWRYFLLFSITTVYVEGEAVRIVEGK
ncbi:MAG: hypothetical protein N2316_08110 [Spirochaetes bacterium]|nr:hypothetical protein [Spirochaetota bacterium]